LGDGFKRARRVRSSLIEVALITAAILTAEVPSRRFGLIEHVRGGDMADDQSLPH